MAFPDRDCGRYLLAQNADSIGLFRFLLRLVGSASGQLTVNQSQMWDLMRWVPPKCRRHQGPSLSPASGFITICLCHCVMKWIFLEKWHISHVCDCGTENVPVVQILPAHSNHSFLSDHSPNYSSDPAVCPTWIYFEFLCKIL